MTAVKRTVSVVPTVKTTECEPIEADAIIKSVISGAWRQEIGQIRDNFNANYSDDHDGKAAKKAISGLKQKLPAVMWAGHFEDRKKGGGKLLQHSGLLCLDLDGFDPDKAVSLVKLKRHRSIYSVFKSPSGNGVKVIFRVPQKEDMHDCAWKAAVQETENLTGAKVDVATKNIASLCFVSHDPDAHFNPEAEELNVPKPTSAPLVMKCESTDELPQRKNIAERILRITKWESETVGFCKCPGIEMHTGKNQPQDCRVSLDGVPTIHCFHDSCGSRVEEANRRLRSDIGKAEAASGDASRGTAKRWFILPGTDSVSITESSERIFGVIGPTKTLFQRGGLVVEKVQDTVGTAALAQVKPAAFRSRLEGYGHTVGAYRVANGLPVLKSTPCPEDMAKALMETIAARTMLPKISAVLSAPVLTEIDGALTILGEGYSSALGGVFVNCGIGRTPPEVPLKEAVASLNGMLDDFNFQTPSDRSRAIASILTPAFRIGGLIPGSTPIDMAEADQSQSGKTYRQKFVAAVYNETPQVISMRRGGVGSLDESLSQAILRAKPIIMFDNIRGKFDSQTLEALLTCNGPFPARVPHRGEVLVDTNRFCFQLTSNGIDTTPDLANRASIIRIQKQPSDYCFKSYEEGDLLEHVKSNQAYYLGCVFEVIRHWHQGGKKRTTETEHDFREWAQTMDWIVQEIFNAAPLMEGHGNAKKRATQPSLNWLRQLAIALEQEGSLSTPITASGIVEFCMEQEIELPSSGAIVDESKAKMRVGAIFKKLFGKGDQVTVERYLVTRGEREEYREEKCDSYKVKEYIFQKQEENPHGSGSPMRSHGDPYNFQENGQCNLENKHTPHGTGGDAVGVNHSPDKKGQLALLGDDSTREVWENFQ